MEHFSEILIRDDPKNPEEEDEIVESEEIEEIDLGRWRLRGQGCDEEDKARESGWSR